MELISAEQLGKAMGTGNFPENINKWLMRLLKLTDINDVYRDTYYLHNEDFIAAVLNQLDIRYFVDEEDLKKIPAEGPFITVSNHPFGVVDGLILLKILMSRRKDFKLMANFLLEHVEPMKEMIFSLNPFEGESAARSSFRGLKQGKLHIENQHCLGVFPAGEVSALRGLKGVGDKEWSNSIVKMVKNANVPVIPIYFHGSNSFMFHLLGLLNPKLRTARLPHEILNKSNKMIQVRIGNVIAPEEIKTFPNVDQLSTFLRAKTYALGSVLNENVAIASLLKFKKPKEITSETDAELLQKEIYGLPDDAFLFETGVYKVYCCTSRHIPHLMYEIGRLREITYREVGEGAGDSLDIDEFDGYYQQLFIWDSKAKKIVGGYRIGEGDKIYETYGKKGFYLNSLFHFSAEFEPYVAQSIELGRSFVVKEYQKKAFSLFCLWKGILHFLMKNKQYRYVVGPVSISNRYSKLSKSLMTDFIYNNYFDFEIARLVSPKKQFKVKLKAREMTNVLGGQTSLSALDKMVEEIEWGKLRVPVLFKKYFAQNARIIGFNRDPKFSNALDGLMILDVENLPLSTIKNLSQGMKNEEEVMERFYGKREEWYANAVQF